MAQTNLGDTIFLKESVAEDVIPSLRTIGRDEIDFGDSIYQQKAQLLNSAIEEIGMGSYQWGLFFLAGFGYFCSNLGLITTALVLPAVVNEFKFRGPLLRLGQSVGLLVGAAFWGVAADIWGRRLSFNITLFLPGMFIVAAGASANSTTLIALASAWSVGVGGNLPVDTAIFLEFLPYTHQYLLTSLSIWWAISQLIGSLVAWALIGRYSCAIGSPCPSNSNKGWRYFLFATGGIMLSLSGVNFLFFKLFESPKYLIGRGKDNEAVEVVHEVAKRNGKISTLTLDCLQNLRRNEDDGRGRHPSSGILEQSLKLFDAKYLRPLFATRKLAWSSSLLIMLWALIGLAYPLYDSFIIYYLATRGATFGDGSIYTTYRNQVILSLAGIPGTSLAGYMVELPFLGRRGTLSLSTLLTGISILGSTTARNSNALLGWNCAYSFVNNIMYGALFAITPELFPTKARGTGNSITCSANRIFGIMAPVVALYANLTTSVPIFISGAIFIVSGILALLLPYESRGRASL